MRLLVPTVAALASLAIVMPAVLRAQQVAVAEQSVSTPENSTGFDSAMREAMRRMDRGMSISHTGNPDRDFAAMMIPHHQGAIDMARAELAFGNDPVLRRLAQAIIVEQQQEIEVMRRRLGVLPAAPAQTPASPHHH